MFTEASKKYLRELKAAQEKVDNIRMVAESEEGETSQILESHTSELKLELGPIKMSMKKSKTVSTNKKSLKSQTSSFEKEKLEKHAASSTDDSSQSINANQSNSNNQLQPRINIVV